MTRYLFLFLFLTAVARPAGAQNRPCPEYERILSTLRRNYQDNLLDSALLQVRYLRACTPAEEQLAEDWTQRIFDKIKVQKAGAETARRDAVESEKKAVAALQKAERLISHFNFGRSRAAWAYQNGRFAVIDRDGNLRTPYQYETPENFVEGLALTRVNGQYVFVSEYGQELSQRYDFVLRTADGFYRAGIGKTEYGYPEMAHRLVVPPGSAGGRNASNRLAQYQTIWKLNQHVYLAQTLENQWQRLGPQGQVLSMTPYTEVWPAGNSFFAVQQGQYWGFMDSTEHWVAPPRFKGADIFQEGLAALRPDSLWGFIDTAGKMVIPPKFQDVDRFSEGLAAARKDTLWGFIDRTGTWVIEPAFQRVSSFENGVAKVSIRENGDLFGSRNLVNKQGKLLYPQQYREIYFRQADGLTWVRNLVSGQIDLIDSAGRILKTLGDFARLHSWENRFLLGTEGRTRKYVDTTGTILDLSQYEAAEVLDHQLFGVKKEGRYYFAGPTGLQKETLTPWENFEGYTGGWNKVGKDGLWGLQDAKGHIILEPRFKSISDFSDGRATIEKDSLWGYIDSTGSEIIPPQFNYAGDFKNKLAKVLQDTLWGLIRPDGTFALPPEFQRIHSYRHGFARVCRDTLWGFIDSTGRIVAQPQYQELGNFENGRAMVRQDSLWGIIDTSGRIVVPPQFKKALDFYKNTAQVWADGRWRAIDRQGVFLPEANPKTGAAASFAKQYAEVIELEMGYIQVRSDSLWGIIDTAGRLRFAPQFNEIWPIDRTTKALARNDSLWGLIDLGGSTLQNPRFQEFIPFDIGYFQMRQDSLWGIMDTLGQLVLPPQFHQINQFQYKLATVRQGNRWGLIDTHGRVLQSPENDEPLFLPFNENFSPFRQGNRWGYIDTLGRMVIEPRFEECSPFQDGFAQIKTGNQWGLIDTSGRITLQPQFDEVWPVSDGVVITKKSGKLGLASPYEPLLSCDYSALHRATQHDYLTEQNGRFGLFNARLHILIPAEYEELGLSGEAFGWVRAKKNGRWGWVDAEGQEKIPFRYDAAMPFKNGEARVRQEPYGRFFKINTAGNMISH